MCLFCKKTWIMLRLGNMRILYPCLDLDLYMLILLWKMFYNVCICCWMFWCIAGAIRMSFGSKIGNFVPQTRRTTLLAKSTLIAKFFRMSHAPAELLAQPSGLGQHALTCWSIPGSVVHSEAFLSTFYNFVTPKQHLINAHNIKQSSNQESWYS
jgi:hypothetical protein